MFSKALSAFVALQVALVFAAPATETLSTTNGANPGATFYDIENINDYLKEPEFNKQLKEFLTDFSATYNSMNKLKKNANLIPPNTDVQTLLRNPSFFSFVSNFFQSQNESGGISGYILNLYNQIVHPKPAPTIATQTKPVEPINPAPVVIPISAETPASNVPAKNPESGNVADLLNQITPAESTPVQQTRPTVVETPAIVPIVPATNKFETESPKATVNNVDNGNYAEDLLKELSKGNSQNVPSPVKAETTNQKLTNELNELAVPANKVTPSQSENWSKVASANSELEAQQAKNAKYSFATQINDLIEGSFQQRAEVRQNGVVTGKYVVDDGDTRRSVFYKADKDGFVITKSETTASEIKGLTGEATVQTLVNGKLLEYHVTEKEIGSKRKAKLSSPLMA